MGWQSYIIPFATDSQRERILEVITKHNAWEIPKDVAEDYWLEHNYPVGENLIQIAECKIIKPYKRGILVNWHRAILCGNGGGRSSTIEWFFDNKIPFELFTRAIHKRLNKEKDWVKLSGDKQ
jgi:hypothetical protein